MSFVMLIAALAQSATAPANVAIEPDAAKMSLKEVRAFNATVDPSHPFFITCRKVEKTGSLVKRGHACRTARHWERIEENGNRQARAVVQDGTTRPGGN